MTLDVESFFILAGAAQASILVASALVPFQLDWKKELGGLSRLHRQMYWTYGGYVVLAIVAFAVIEIAAAAELAVPSRLARFVSAYIAVFWGVRFALQFVFDAQSHLTTWWLRLGYRLLSILFLVLAIFHAWAALR